MSSKNPLAILWDELQIGKQAWAHMIPYKNPTPEFLQSLYHKKELEPRLKEALFDQIMVIWGQDPKNRQSLWNCYFPTTKPHCLHIMVYQVGISRERIMKILEANDRTLMKLLKRPKMTQYHLRRVAPLADVVCSSLYSRNDALYTVLYRAVRDPQRIYKSGQIIGD